MRTAPWTLQQGFDHSSITSWKGKAGEANAVRNATYALAFFGSSTLLDSITTERVDAWIASLKAGGNSNATINRKLAALSKIMTDAHRRGKTSGVRPHLERQRESEGRIRYLTPDEESRSLALLRAWGKDQHAEVLCVLVDSGLRPSELWRLEKRDVNLENGTMAIWKAKNSRPRSVPMTARVKGIIAARQELANMGRLFPHDNAWLDHAWYRLKCAMGLSSDNQFVPYTLRHTCASRLIQRGVQLSVVREWMGHSNISMTLRYAHLSPTCLLEAVNVLEPVCQKDNAT